MFRGSKKPAFLPLRPESIPDELKSWPQWVLWKAEKRDGKVTKVPYRAGSGKRAKVNDPSHWCDFQTVIEAYNKAPGRWAGIGFVLTEGDPFVAIDLDKVTDGGQLDSGQFNALPAAVQGILRGVDSYVEVSPSGTGLRVFLVGSLPPGGRKKGTIEVYDNGRYVTLTGHHLEGTPRTIEQRQAQIEAFHKKVFGSPKTANKPPSHTPSCSLPDDDIMQKMLASVSGSKVSQLMAGDTTGYPSHSEADAALCGHLAFWCGRDAQRMDAVFRSSGLMREKWDKRHHADGRTYGQATINRAIEQCQEVYTPRGGHEGQTSDESNALSDEAFLEKYKEISDPDADQIAQFKKAVVKYFNDKGYAAIMIDGKFCVVLEYKNPTTGRNDLAYMRKVDFLNKFENRTGITGRNKNGFIYSSWAQIWLKSPDRRQYEGIVFDTTGKANGRFFNIFRPCTPPAGPATCEEYLSHVKTVICRGDENGFEWLLDWMAWLYQNRGNKRPGTSIVLRGMQGTGKGSFVLPFGQLFGDHFLHITTQSQFTGRFTEHLKNAILVFLDEALWAGDRKSEGQLKAFITEPYILIEGKFINPYTIKNHVNLIFASNSEWIVPTGLGERRFFALHVSEDHKQDYPYFNRIKNQMQKGGTADLARFLLARKVTHNLREAPRTDEFLAQVLESMDPEQSFWFEALKSGLLIDPHNISEIPLDWPELMSKRGLWDQYRAYCQKLNIHSRFLTDAQFGRRLRAIAPIQDGPRCVDHDERVSFSDRMTTYRVPPLQVARERFESLIRYQINWDSDDETPF